MSLARAPTGVYNRADTNVDRDSPSAARTATAALAPLTSDVGFADPAPIAAARRDRPTVDRPSNAGPAVRRLLCLPRTPLGSWPTPIERLPSPAGGQVWVKRDDLSAWGRAGSKTRKLEYLLGRLRDRGHDEVITVTGNVTNLVFDLLPALERHGIAAQVLVADYPRVARKEREAIFAGVRSRVRLLGSSKLGAFSLAFSAWTRSRARGGRPFFMPPGLAHPTGVVAGAAGLVELAEQLEASGQPWPRVVFVATATGTTVAGLLLAAHALARDGLPAVRVVGVAADRAPLRAITLGLIRWTEHALRIPTPVPAEDIQIVSLEGRPAFAAYDEELAERCRRLERESGLRIDPLFGGRAWCAMERFLRLTSGDARVPVLFWHCGYTPEWRTLGALHRSGDGPA